MIEAMAESPQIRGGPLLTSRDKYTDHVRCHDMATGHNNCCFECQYIAVMCEIDVAKLHNYLTATVDILKPLSENQLSPRTRGPMTRCPPPPPI